MPSKLLFLLLAIVPTIDIVFALPTVGTLVAVGLVVFWMFFPSWGPWVYIGVSLNLLRSRATLLYLQRVNMATYVFSPSMGIQNRSSAFLALGGIIGAIRSFLAGDLTGAALGGLVAILLFGLQGLLFPNPEVISQACGYPAVISSQEELRSLLETRSAAATLWGGGSMRLAAR